VALLLERSRRGVLLDPADVDAPLLHPTGRAENRRKRVVKRSPTPYKIVIERRFALRIANATFLNAPGGPGQLGRDGGRARGEAVARLTGRARRAHAAPAAQQAAAQKSHRVGPNRGPSSGL
jgi:hypothetical protein